MNFSLEIRAAGTAYKSIKGLWTVSAWVMCRSACDPVPSSGSVCQCGLVCSSCCAFTECTTNKQKIAVMATGGCLWRIGEGVWAEFIMISGPKSNRILGKVHATILFMKKDTSWGKVALWYDEHLKGDNTYHEQVVAPNLLRVVNLKSDQSLLELGCGQGFFVDRFSKLSDKVVGVDLGKELIEIAKKKIPKVKFFVGNAESEKILIGEKFDCITIILALQNMKDLNAVTKNLDRLLAPGGKVVIVINHPTFRIAKNSEWGIDKEKNIQYRRVDAYMSEMEMTIDMTPGKTSGKEMTVSYHRPLQVYSKAFGKAGFAIVKIEEWISHRKSAGVHAKMEDTARKEIPLFMCLVLKKV